MKTVLLISSLVARGRVGIRAGAPVFESFGIDTIQIPTVFYSNHPGHGHHKGRVSPSRMISEIVATLESRNWLAAVDCVLVGYFANADQALAAEQAVQKVRKANPDALVACDPILGDDEEGLYVAEEVVEIVAERLAPVADVTLPNRFELEHLRGAPAGDLEACIRLARGLSRETVVTSAPAGPGKASAVVATAEGAWLYEADRVEGAPSHGAGDVFSAAYLSQRLMGADPAKALGSSCAAMRALMEKSVGLDELALVASLDAIVTGEAKPASPVALN